VVLRTTYSVGGTRIAVRPGSPAHTRTHTRAYSFAIILDNLKLANSVSVYVYDCDIRTKVASVVVFYVFRQAVKKATEFYSTTELEYVIV
jgi:hypothetical protein